MKILWVVEMWIKYKWEPTVSVSRSRDDGRLELSECRIVNPSDKFRLVQYRRKP